MSFRGFLGELRAAGLMKTVTEPANPQMEVTEKAWGAGPIFWPRAAISASPTSPAMAAAA